MTKQPTHQCPIPNCRAVIQKNVVVCRAHAKMASTEAHQSVWATWKSYREAKIDETRVEAFRLYRFACEALVNEIKDDLKKRKAA